MDKPPIGVRPSWFALPHRIKELADAISRYTEHKRMCTSKEATQLIREWATEIIGMCDTIDKVIDVKESAK